MQRAGGTTSPPVPTSEPGESPAVGGGGGARAGRPVPPSVVALVSALLLGTAAFLAVNSLALAGDGAYYLLRILGTDSVAGPDARIFGNAVRQAPVFLAVALGETDTHRLSILLGAGQLVLPAAVWSLALVLARSHTLAFCAVAIAAGICAGTTWYFSVGENVLAVPLTVLVAVVLWRQRPWRRRDVAVAAGASLVLVASYEPAALTAPLLAVWAAWRAASSSGRERWGAGAVSLLSAAAALHGWWRIVEARDQENAQAFLNDILAVRPAESFLALASGMALVYAMTFPDGRARRMWLAVGAVCGAVTVLGLATTSYTEAYAARGAAVMVALVLELFLFGLWAARSAGRGSDALAARDAFVQGRGWPLAVATLFVGVMVGVDVLRLDAWRESLRAFKDEVDRTQGTVNVDDVLPRDRRQVLFGWTSSSLSLIVRRDARSGVLVDTRPTFVPFPPGSARAQLDERYRWGS